MKCISHLKVFDSITRSLENAHDRVSLEPPLSWCCIHFPSRTPCLARPAQPSSCTNIRSDHLSGVIPIIPIASGLPISKTSSGREESLFASREAKQLKRKRIQKDRGCRSVQRCNTPFPALRPIKPQSKRFANKLVNGQNQSISAANYCSCTDCRGWNSCLSPPFWRVQNIANCLHIHLVARSISGKDVFISQR